MFKKTGQHAAYLGLVFIAPPLILWLSVLVYLITGVNFFTRLLDAAPAFRVLFSEFFIVLGYPAVAIALGIMARKNPVDMPQESWVRSIGTTVVTLATIFIILTLLAAL